MNHLKIKKEEFDTSRAEIARAESLWDKNFPSDYVNFLLENNGGVVYPNNPNLGPDNKTEIWPVERFLSIGDIILQKHNQISSSRIEIEDRHLEEFNLSSQDILIFAQGERGAYFLSLAEKEYGQIYIANFAGGDGISRTCARTFTQFISSLGMAEWDDRKFDPDFTFTEEYHTGIKVMQYYLFHTPSNPKLGFKRFKEVFDYFETTTKTKDGFKGIAYKYVDDKPKLNYLLEKGCETDNLLRGAKKADTIDFLVNELKLDINKIDNGRYPIQNYLTDKPDFYAKQNYELIDELLKRKIPLDWSIQTKTYDGKKEAPTIDRLLNLHNKYQEMIVKEQEFQNKYKRPSGVPPFIKSELIEEKLGIKQQNDNWIDKLLNKITRGNNK